MFTGIIEGIGIIESVSIENDNRTFWIRSSISNELRIDQSVSHNGACLTVEELRPGAHRVTAIAETIQKTDLGDWITGQEINLERSMLMNGRLDGHIVQGHVDTIAECTGITDDNGSWLYRFRFPRSFAELIIEKGSICVNGISLTLFSVTETEFSVAIIPYTYSFTNLKNLQPGKSVNLEFDMLGKYISRIHSLRSGAHS